MPAKPETTRKLTEREWLEVDESLAYNSERYLAASRTTNNKKWQRIWVTNADKLIEIRRKLKEQA